ncbi:LacI family DNA-binding transcriptional regulator [Lentzea sp. NPDC058436]|uniref:LacI family DNA-binding transcriptional regulator n=1 Tax=Lentzea sp. NPDC058436 TaxID=3346499 RepID=UPI00365D4656
MSTGEPDRHVTIYDVASRAGVSITTVSNVLNRPGRVGAATLRKVLAVIDELGFTPKAAAVSQARKGVGRIGVLAPFSSYTSYHERLCGVLRAVRDTAFEVVVYDQESAASASSPLLSSLPTTGRLDGLLVLGLPLDPEMADRLVQRNLPTVLVDSFQRGLSTVNVDDEHGGFVLGQHLVGQGYRRFVYVSEAQRSDAFVSPGQLRLRGLRRAFARGGLPEESLSHVITSHDIAGGRAAAKEIAGWVERPDVVIAHFDDIAAGVVAGFQEAGIRVPSDVAVAGYDDGPVAEAMGITTVRQPFFETGRVGGALLIDQVQGVSSSVQHVELAAELVVRTSA